MLKYATYSLCVCMHRCARATTQVHFNAQIVHNYIDVLIIDIDVIYLNERNI